VDSAPIRRKLARDGYVTRNQCLSQFPAITRLGARIKDLEKEGYVFKPERRGKDYVYTVLTRPEGSRPQTKLDHFADAHKKVALFDAGAPAETIFAA
jgi:hypothetical protein